MLALSASSVIASATSWVLSQRSASTSSMQPMAVITLEPLIDASPSRSLNTIGETPADFSASAPGILLPL